MKGIAGLVVQQWCFFTVCGEKKNKRKALTRGAGLRPD